jgi:acylpyruvate hydrolase
MHIQVNNEFKQRGVTSDMIFPINKLIRHVSSIMTLSVCFFFQLHPSSASTDISEAHSQEGDLILTGTPSGVGPVKSSDKISVGLTYPGLNGEAMETLEFDCVDRDGGYEFKGK